MKPRDPLLDAASRVAWSHWTALGVSGVVPPPETAVDPESLVLLTAALGDFDPRLLDEATDWCIRYARRFISLSRLRNLLERVDAETQQSFADLAAVVNEHGGTRWPTSARPRRFSPSGKSKLEKLDLAAQALLRLRCAVGINARAEILHTLITAHSQNHWMNASAFTELGYGKRNLADILDDLVLGGLLMVRRLGNANGYRLRASHLLRPVLDPIPWRSGRWHLRMPLLAHFVRLQRHGVRKEPIVRAVETRRLLDELAPTFAMLEFEPPVPSDPKLFADEINRWIIEKVIEAP